MKLDEAAQHLEGCYLPPPADEARNMLLAELERLQAIEQRARAMTTNGRTALERAAGEHILGQQQ
jgi:hypothetical protein